MWLSIHLSICLYAKPNTLENKIVVPYCNHSYYVASSASGQDDPNCALWLVTQAGKMEPSCPLGTTRCIPQAKFPRKPYNKSFIDQVCSVKMTGYWPGSFFAHLWTLTSSQSINTQKKKNLANIQPSWPHTWSVTHTWYWTSMICIHVLVNWQLSNQGIHWPVVSHDRIAGSGLEFIKVLCGFFSWLLNRYWFFIVLQAQVRLLL